eukprot:2673660-Rhodomonas_salina.3
MAIPSLCRSCSAVFRSCPLNASIPLALGPDLTACALSLDLGPQRSALQGVCEDPSDRATMAPEGAFDDALGDLVPIPNPNPEPRVEDDIFHAMIWGSGP